MSDRNKMVQTVGVLEKIEDRLGGHHPISSNSIRQLLDDPVASLESAASMIKLKSSLNVEIFDDNIRKLVNNFYDFSAVYRENHTDRFIEDIRSLEQYLKKDEREFVDKLRWSDDDQYVNKIRLPVSNAYLNLFEETVSVKTVVPDDFWKCTNFPQLLLDIKKTLDYRKISTIFTLPNVADKVTSVIVLLLELRKSCVNLSQNFEDAIDQCINKLMRNESIPATNVIDFDASRAIVLGVEIKPEITNAINRVWYKKNIETTIGGMVTDTRLLLADVIELCTPNEVEAGSIEHLFKYAHSAESAENLRLIQREFVNIVEQVDMSSRRLTKLIERLSEVPESPDNGTYNYSLHDLSVLVSIYSGSLSELVIFTVSVAEYFEQSYEAVNAMVSKVSTLKHEVDRYVAKRLKA